MTKLTCPNCGTTYKPAVKESDDFPLLCEDFGGNCLEPLPWELRSLVMEYLSMKHDN